MIRIAHNFVDLVGRQFGHLVVVQRAPNHGAHTRWLCQCDCGNTTVVDAYDLKHGQIKSCKCSRPEFVRRSRIKHGQAGRKNRSHEYSVWTGAKSRCFNSKTKRYRDYGGRGITMCEAWRDSFEAFFAHIGPCPAGLTLDRHPDNNGNYEPGNVRWATRLEQRHNRRDSRHDISPAIAS